MNDATSAEVEPPWITYPGESPQSRVWRLGAEQEWLSGVFPPFWDGLDPAAKGRYLGEWPPSDEDWRQHADNDFRPTEVEPPWVKYPYSEAWWSGWRQGSGEYRLMNDFFPFWATLDPAARDRYLSRWPAPSESYRRSLDPHYGSRARLPPEIPELVIDPDGGWRLVKRGVHDR